MPTAGTQYSEFWLAILPRDRELELCELQSGESVDIVVARLKGRASVPGADQAEMLLGAAETLAMHALLAGLRERKAVAVSSCGELFENGSTSAIRCMFVPAPEEDLPDGVPPAS